jgi:DNA polymerase elongation subunit (family B)
MEVRLFDFQIVNRRDPEIDDDEHIDAQLFVIQMFGINEKGETFSIEAHDFKPYFYCLVPQNFTIADKRQFLEHIKQKIGKYYADSILDCVLVKRKKIDGFDAQSDHSFICFKFRGMPSFYKVRNLWYDEIRKGDETKQILKAGYFYQGKLIRLYESNIPPLLRFFHIKEISPSGWIQIPKVKEVAQRTTTCTYEFIVKTKDIVALQKETVVPYKICSFDIEASSSHGDFPVPVKDYKRLAEQISECEDDIDLCIYAAFGYISLPTIDIVYPKNPISKDEIASLLPIWKKMKICGTIIDNYESDSSEEEAVVDETGMILSELLVSDHPNKAVELRKALNSVFPPLEGDTVTFIGSTFVKCGVSVLNHCIVLGGCEPIANAEIECYQEERDVLVAWTRLIQKEDPDIMIGYNIFGFDEQFLFKRALETNCVEDFLDLTRNKNVMAGKQTDEVWDIEKKTVFLASGEYNLNYFKMDGRIHIDLYTVFRRDYNFDSYKLDSVSSYFIGDKVQRIDGCKVYTKNFQGLEVSNYISFETKKYKVIHIQADYFEVAEPILEPANRWCLVKDDVDHHDIFRLSKGSDADRAIIAAYCIQDCNLVQHLFKKTDMLTGFIEMSSICSVPIEFLIMRGQGIKLTSYISKQCRKRNTLMPVLPVKEFDGGYEGAIVLDPKCAIYTDPVAVCDYKSLYPSSMISENICSSSKVWTKEYNLEKTLLRETGSQKFDNLPNYKYVDIEYDTYQYVRKTPKSKAVKTKVGTKVCRFAQFIDGKAIMPAVLEELLKARSATRKQIANEPDEFMKNILDKRQNAYKVTANSLYGQCGARTSTFYDKDVAASCTAVGRKLLIYSKTLIEEVYHQRMCSTSSGPVCATAEYIYGDTDSVFFKFTLFKEGKLIQGKDALALTIELAKEAGQLATQFLKMPHELEYEKTFYPFVLLSKKRYVGMLYEHDTEHCSRKSMGIVLKRRDNAPIVKDVYGGLIDILMQERNAIKAVEYVKKCIHEVRRGEVPIEKLILTKALRSGYKKPQQIAHKVLAIRIGKRDPGNKPKPGDRIRFIYVQTKHTKKQLQGEKIETPEFMKEKGLLPDYEHYISNQLMKPIEQVIELVLDEIPEYQDRKIQVEQELEEWKEKLTPEKYADKREKIRLREVNHLLTL